MSEAIDKLVELLRPPNELDAATRRLHAVVWERRIQMLIMGWPSLAATLAQLLEETGERAPLALKRAYQIMEKEQRGRGEDSPMA